MTELAVAYVSIVPETSRIAPGIRAALNQGESAASASGQRMGSAMSTAIGTALGIGVSKAAGLATRTISDALKGGFERLNTLEKANIQFRNMGLTASQAQRQINDLNDIVSGTSTSLSDAAGAAAMLGGAGVKSGKDMNDAVKALVNVSAASGAAAKDIGLVMMQIKASGKLMGGDALQLAQRGVPVYDLVAKSIGKTTAEVRKMGEQGEISFDMVVKAINDGTGNLAKEMGATLPAKLANLRTAMNRLTAAGMEPFLLRAKSGATDLTNAVNTLTPKVKDFAIALDEKIFDEWGPKIKAALESFEKTGSIDELKTTLMGLWDAMKDGIQATSGIRASLMQASAALGVSGWQILLVALQAATGALNALNPLLSGLGNLMQSHQGIVTALAGAFLLFKTIPGIMGRVTTSLAPMGSALATARSSVAGFGSAWRTSIGYMQQANPAMSGFGAGVRVLGANAGAAARGGLAMLKNAGSAVAGVFGGPVGIALAAAATYVMLGVSAHQEAAQKALAHSDAVKALEQSELKLGSALIKTRGEMSDDAWSVATQQLEAYQKTLQTTADKHQSTWDQLKSFGGIAKLALNTEGANNSAAEQAMAAQKAIADLGMTNDDVAKRMYGTRDQYLSLFNELVQMGDGGRKAAQEISQLRAEFDRQQDLARRVTPGVTELGEAMQKMGDSSSSAADKLKALKDAMDALNPARTEGDAIARHNEVLQQVAQSTQEAIDRTRGFGAALLDQQLGVNTATSNGQQLCKSLVDIVDATADAAASGANLAERQQANQVALAQLATQYGLTTEQIRRAADQLGLDDIEIVVALKGAPETLQHIASISQAWNEVPTQKTVTVQADQVTDDTRAMLQRMNLTVSQPMNGTVTITANDALAQQRIQMITQNMSVLNALKANPTLDLNTLSFTANNDAARAALTQLQGTEANAKAGLIIQDLLNGQAVSMTKLDELRNSTTNPSVQLVIDELLKNAAIANSTLDSTSRVRDANIQVNLVPGTNGVPGAYQFGLNVPTGAGADGMIRQYANGGINAMEQYANGKLPNQAVLQKAMPHSLIQWAEPETGGEAFIPLAGSKRSRSTDILAAVAKMFGYALVPQGNLPSTVSGMLGSLTGGALSRLMALTGVDKLGVTAYANGGMDAAGLRKLAEGQGASRPLTGAPYVWGGVNWGDCAGAMSAFARAAVGLDPFGGRFSTASESSQLQSMGFTLGQGSSGDLRFGWYNGGVGGGHTAGTLPDGTNIEMGGNNGGGALGGGAVGADSPQFTDHAFLTIGPGLPTTGTGATDPGGFVTRPDGTIVYQPGNGNYGATGGAGSGSTTGSSGTSISSRFGSAVGAFVEGQIADVFQTLGANDSPGIVSAIADYENAQRSKQSGQGVDTSALKKSYDDAVTKSNRQFDADKARIDEDLKSHKINQAERDQKVADLTKKHEDTLAQAKQKYDQATKPRSTDSYVVGRCGIDEMPCLRDRMRLV
ncbi:tape measure protein [Gordonia oryzae]|uniref:tape measure protein n=1 Tax=Gordonia oryzae TaxID=2487349 RepID=UPI003F8724C9